MNFVKRSAKRALSIMLVLALVMGSAFTGGLFANWGGAVYADDSATINVTINGSENFTGIEHPVIGQELTVDKFDLTPFLSPGEDGFTAPTAVVTGHVLVEAIYYSLYGEDPTPEQLAVDAESATAAAIRGKLNITNSTAYGISQNSIYDDATYMCSAVNHAMGMGLSYDDVHNGDVVEFYPYIVGKDYSYFNLLAKDTSVEDYGDYGVYAGFKLTLKQKSFSYVTGTNPVNSATVGVVGDSSSEKTTDNNGNVVLNIWENVGKSAKTGTFIVRGAKDSVVPAYLRVSYSYDGSRITDFVVSESIYNIKDTSLATFTINGKNAKFFLANDLDFTVVSTEDDVTLDVSLTDDDAVIEGKEIYVGGELSSAEFPYTTGGAVAVPLAAGGKTVRFTVINDTDKEVYELNVVKTSSAADVSAAVTRIINGIADADYSGQEKDTYTSNWILAKEKAGKALSDTEKETFIKNALYNAKNPAQSAGSAAKDAIALSKLGIDATKVKSIIGEEDIDLIKKAFKNANNIDIYSLPYVLMLMDLGPYESSNANCTRAKLIQRVISTYSGSAGWGKDNSYGPDTSAMMLPALVKYYNAAGTGVDGVSGSLCTQVKNLVDAEIANYRNLMDSGSGVIINSNSTSVVISALAAYGIDAATFNNGGNSLLEGLLMYESADNRLGYMDTTYNAYASWQGMEALANYKDFQNGGNGNDFAFDATIAECTDWPEVNFMTDLLVTEPTKTTYNVGDNFDITGMVVKPVYNGNVEAATPITSYSVTPADGTVLDTVGVKTVKVSFNGMDKTFNIVVNADNDTPYAAKKVNITVQGENSTVVPKTSIVINPGVTTVMDVLKTVLNKAGKTCVIEKNGSYIASIDGLGEFDRGENSGWMYNVNRVTVQTSANDYVLNGGEEILWYYTLNWKTDSRNTGMKSDETPTTDTTASESVEATATVKDGKAVAEVKAADVAKAIEKVGGEKADNKEVVLEIKGTNGADAIEAGIPAAAVKELDKADVDVAIKTEGGNVTIPADAMGNIAAQTGGSDLVVSMENKKPADAATAAGGAENLAKEAGISSEVLAGASITEVNMTAGGKNITSFGGSNIELYIPLKGNFVAGHSYLAASISKNGAIESFIADCVKMAGQLFAKVKSGHLTTFVITNEEVKNPFTDVKSGDYFFQPVLWAVNKEVTSGLSETTFGPNAGCTRAQMVTFLWRAAGKPWASANRHFSDVAEGAYYKDAIEWAVASGITNGVSEDKFAPDATVTREQLASFLYRYAQSKGQGFTGAWMFLLDYSDASKISSWADEAMHWCVMKEIVGGTGNKMLSPQGTATRGQIVTMLYRFFNL